MQPIILASKSQQRADILRTLRIQFTIVPSHINEKAVRHTDSKKQATRIAQAKAHAVSHMHTGIIIAADTFSVINRHVFEKPKNTAEAYYMLEQLSGKESVCYTGFCYIDKKNKINTAGTVAIRVRFRHISKTDITHHIQTHPVTQWASGFSPAYVDTLNFVSSIQGSLTGFTHGLPLEHIIPLLKKSGFCV